mmetsp:Transcript_17635/g.42770  ORF Transcript_17635/g.42770 Transcript_17635/m.42770 type:complete len:207 (-) Transcript_17635:9852-10472(-)
MLLSPFPGLPASRYECSHREKAARRSFLTSSSKAAQACWEPRLDSRWCEARAKAVTAWMWAWTPGSAYWEWVTALSQNSTIAPSEYASDSAVHGRSRSKHSGAANERCSRLTSLARETGDGLARPRPVSFTRRSVVSSTLPGQTLPCVQPRPCMWSRPCATSRRVRTKVRAVGPSLLQMTLCRVSPSYHGSTRQCHASSLAIPCIT